MPELLSRRGVALQLDKNEIARIEPDTLREPQRRCALCESREECELGLADDFADVAWARRGPRCGHFGEAARAQRNRPALARCAGVMASGLCPTYVLHKSLAPPSYFPVAAGDLLGSYDAGIARRETAAIRSLAISASKIRCASHRRDPACDLGEDAGIRRMMCDAAHGTLLCSRAGSRNISQRRPCRGPALRRFLGLTSQVRAQRYAGVL